MECQSFLYKVSVVEAGSTSEELFLFLFSFLANELLKRLGYVLAQFLVFDMYASVERATVKCLATVHKKKLANWLYLPHTTSDFPSKASNDFANSSCR
jgi:hypothetical protein